MHTATTTIRQIAFSLSLLSWYEHKWETGPTSPSCDLSYVFLPLPSPISIHVLSLFFLTDTFALSGECPRQKGPTLISFQYAKRQGTYRSTCCCQIVPFCVCVGLLLLLFFLPVDVVLEADEDNARGKAARALKRDRRNKEWKK